jgi:hypothetical protein
MPAYCGHMNWRRTPKRWKRLRSLERRSPKWLASRHRRTLIRAVEYAKSRSAAFDEPMKSLWKSARYEEFSPIFRAAVVSFEAPPFKGGLHQTYAWPRIACVTWRQFSDELVADLEDYVRHDRRSNHRRAIGYLHRGRRAFLLAPDRSCPHIWCGGARKGHFDAHTEAGVRPDERAHMISRSSARQRFVVLSKAQVAQTASRRRHLKSA